MVRITLLPLVLASMAVAAPAANNGGYDTPPAFDSKPIIFDRAASDAEEVNLFESKPLHFKRDDVGVPADNEVTKGMMSTWNAWRSKLGRPPLTWNFNMTVNPQYWANNCDYGLKSKVNPAASYESTNGYKYMWGNAKNTSDANTRIKFRNEVNRYMSTGKNYDWDNPIDPLADNTVAWDFIGIAWSNTTEIGCGWNYCPGEPKPAHPGFGDALLMACEYNGQSYLQYQGHEAAYAENMKPPPESVDYDAYY